MEQGKPADGRPSLQAVSAAPQSRPGRSASRQPARSRLRLTVLPAGPPPRRRAPPRGPARPACPRHGFVAGSPPCGAPPPPRCEAAPRSRVQPPPWTLWPQSSPAPAWTPSSRPGSGRTVATRGPVAGLPSFPDQHPDGGSVSGALHSRLERGAAYRTGIRAGRDLPAGAALPGRKPALADAVADGRAATRAPAGGSWPGRWRCRGFLRRQVHPRTS
ncbi:hypothetical protein J2850_004961 [Azospirillum picis]|uniref:Uncharacterized protein n=1 Tax=Azospirillum picis TaxID=488438 RepID=A0ABU0MQQ3_9PROT|nr:hypothetical protein [Azospirillum picis]MDQ0535809.1 hypothetical protein [Azospirillum picis]